jgi:hypothetical protein
VNNIVNEFITNKVNRSNFISEFTRINRRYEVKYLPRVERAIRFHVKRVIAALKNGGVPAAQQALHSQVGNPALSAVVRNLYREVGSRHARLNYSRLLAVERQEKGFGFSAEWTSYILDYLQRFLLDRITFRVAETTRDMMLRVLNAATVRGDSIDQIVDAFENWERPRYQAARIVRTEVNRAANVGASAQEKTSKYHQVKIWISANDFRVRGQNPKDHASHIGLNGTTIDAGDNFKDPRNGDLLAFPGDPKASAESTINCRCAVGYEFKRDSNGELIPKKSRVAVIYPNELTMRQNITV